MEARDWEAEGTFDERIENVETAIARLREMLERCDEPGAILAAAQLRRVLEVAEVSAIAIGVAQIDMHPGASAALHAVQSAAWPLLECVPVHLSSYASIRRFLARFKVDV